VHQLPTAISATVRVLVATHLVSPAMAAAAALKGHFTDVRDLL